MEWITKITVEKDAIDVLNHVNNTVYITYLEQARIEWYREVAEFYKMNKSNENLSVVVLHLDVLFKQEAVLGDQLTITTNPKKLGTKSFVLDQLIYNQRNELITEAKVTNVMFDLNDRKSIPVVEGIAKLF